MAPSLFFWMTLPSLPLLCLAPIPVLSQTIVTDTLIISTTALLVTVSDYFSN